jgi:hypothetical protein
VVVLGVVLVGAGRGAEDGGGVRDDDDDGIVGGIVGSVGRTVGLVVHMYISRRNRVLCVFFLWLSCIRSVGTSRRPNYAATSTASLADTTWNQPL